MHVPADTEQPNLMQNCAVGGLKPSFILLPLATLLTLHKNYFSFICAPTETRHWLASTVANKYYFYKFQEILLSDLPSLSEAPKVLPSILQNRSHFFAFFCSAEAVMERKTPSRARNAVIHCSCLTLRALFALAFSRRLKNAKKYNVCTAG